MPGWIQKGCKKFTLLIEHNVFVVIGYLPAIVSQQMLGRIGDYMMFVLTLVVVITSVSSGILSISSVIIYDIYQRYISPFQFDQSLSTGYDRRKLDAQNYMPYNRTCMRLKHGVVIVVSALMFPLTLVLLAIGVDLPWLFQFMGIIGGSSVIPVMLAISWHRTTGSGVTVGVLTGLVSALAAWLGYASYRPQRACLVPGQHWGADGQHSRSVGCPWCRRGGVRGREPLVRGMRSGSRGGGRLGSLLPDRQPDRSLDDEIRPADPRKPEGSVDDRKSSSSCVPRETRLQGRRTVGVHRWGGVVLGCDARLAGFHALRQSLLPGCVHKLGDAGSRVWCIGRRVYRGGAARVRGRAGLPRGVQHPGLEVPGREGEQNERRSIERGQVDMWTAEQRHGSKYLHTRLSG